MGGKKEKNGEYTYKYIHIKIKKTPHNYYSAYSYNCSHGHSWYL